MDKTIEFKTQLNKFIFDILSSYKFKENITSLINEELKKTILLKKETLFEAEGYINIKENIKVRITESLKNGDLKQDVYKFIDSNLKSLENSNSTLDTIIPAAFINGIKVYIYNNSGEIVASLKKFLTSENIDKKINEEIIKILNSINPMASKFINANIINTKILDAINEYIDDPKNIINIINMLNSQLDNLMKKKISEFAVYFPVEGRKSLVNSMSNNLTNKLLSENFINMVINKAEEMLKYEFSLLNENSEILANNINKLINSFIETNYTKLLESTELKTLIDEFSSNKIDNLLQKPLKDFI
ncbi:hypothetical protein M2651_10570 [Clostridium sp. SYSU_GA19001]|uniref:hypothetical protein n=1 Tax=Clostridium caldaquaticum TaxID=2940653 RepID=UPI0020775599|nr:hypothetical protein [Clostridium caldaquaticum]MCM8711464.1 hypothetical protein [Clostridium caldaquaticum]